MFNIFQIMCPPTELGLQFPECYHNDWELLRFTACIYTENLKRKKLHYENYYGDKTCITYFIICLLILYCILVFFLPRTQDVGSTRSFPPTTVTS